MLRVNLHFLLLLQNLMAAVKISKRAVDDGKREREGACLVPSDLIRADKGSVVGNINKMN